MKLSHLLALVSWFAGGIAFGLVEASTLPSDPNYSILLQLLPLFLLVGGTWFVVQEFQRFGESHSVSSGRLRKAMILGWIAVFGIDAGIASLNNMSFQIFHVLLPYYYQGVNLAQKIITLAGIFTLGIASALGSRSQPGQRVSIGPHSSTDFWEKPVTNIGFTSLLLGIVLGLGQYWSSVVFAGFILLLAGVFLLPLGILTEKQPDTSR